ncbi:MAG: 50S ribosomal protein L4 [Thermoanaerobaculia bacterium]|nr:50S ribosomal protein L4 [Thermoanaerobaculia bacterium]
MKVSVRNLENKVVREIELPESVFDYPFKEHLIHTAVEAYRAGIRRGTHKTKHRGEVAGSNKKPWRQKGTGRARAGEAGSPLWRSGGIVHGPRPRDYGKDLSVREKKNALKSVLAQKVRQDELVVVEDFRLDSHKTKNLVTRLQGLGVDGKALLVDQFGNDNLLLAARNHPNLKAVNARAVNVYDAVGRRLVLSAEALESLVEVLS